MTIHQPIDDDACSTSKLVPPFAAQLLDDHVTFTPRLGTIKGNKGANIQSFGFQLMLFLQPILAILTTIAISILHHHF